VPTNKEARRQRNEAARTATTSVKAALEHAPAELPPALKLAANFADQGASSAVELTHVVGGVVKGGAGIITFGRSMNALDPYNIAHPAEYYQNVNMTLAGLTSTVAHPDRALKDAWQSAKRDPSEFGGRVVLDLLGTKGAGAARGAATGGIKGTLRHAAEDVLDSGKKPDVSARERVSDGPGRDSRQPDAVESRGSDPIDFATGRMYLPPDGRGAARRPSAGVQTPRRVGLPPGQVVRPVLVLHRRPAPGDRLRGRRARLPEKTPHTPSKKPWEHFQQKLNGHSTGHEKVGSWFRRGFYGKPMGSTVQHSPTLSTP
jgi:hypothetical protein